MNDLYIYTFENEENTVDFNFQCDFVNPVPDV